MKILALEFSSALRSVAVGETRTNGVELLATSAEQSARGVTGIVLIDRALREADLAPEAIELIAIGLGPGSYAGIRSAIALGQGWQLARSTRLIGVSSVELLARDARERELFGTVTFVVDAQRRECYRTVYEIDSGGCRQIVPLGIVPAETLHGAPGVVGPEAARLVPGASDLFPDAGVLLRIAAERSEFTPGEQLEPIYLRETTFLKAPPRSRGLGNAR